MDRIIYEQKDIGTITFYDYWNLSEHPIYVFLDNKKKPYIRYDEAPHKNYVKVNSLQDIANYLRKNEWAFFGKYWASISKDVQSIISIPHTDINNTQ